MRVQLRGVLGVMAIALLMTGNALARQSAAEEVATILTLGTMTQAAAELEKLAAQDGDDTVRFALAIAQTLQAVENFAAALHRYGLRSDTWSRGMPFLRVPVPPNPNPEPIGYDDARAVAQKWLDDMQRVRETLSQIKDPASVKLPLPIGLMHLDLNGDSKADEKETLWQLFNVINPRSRVAEQDAQNFIIALDGGDVEWLHGYTHLLSALPEMKLAYDARQQFEATGHIFFTKIKTPHAYLNDGKKVADFGFGVDIADAIAFVHLINLPLKEPQRMQRALEHLQSMLRHSRKSWDLILAETDDDREWIPNPRQQSIFPNMAVNDEMIDTWMAFLDEADAVLAGKKLIPFWRSRDGRGVNLRRVFTEPTQFDLVLWIQGTAATPYLEEGDVTSPATWRRFQQVFRGEFLTFAVWFN